MGGMLPNALCASDPEPWPACALQEHIKELLAVSGQGLTFERKSMTSRASLQRAFMTAGGRLDYDAFPSRW